LNGVSSTLLYPTLSKLAYTSSSFRLMDKSLVLFTANGLVNKANVKLCTGVTLCYNGLGEEHITRSLADVRGQVVQKNKRANKQQQHHHVMYKQK
jgi:hypothetical protein